MTTLAGAILLIGRIQFAGLFAFAARGHIENHARYVGTAQGKMPLPFLAGWPTGVFLLLGDVSIVAGIWPHIGALTIAAFLLPAALLTVVGHISLAVTDSAINLR